jgi:hypothetical protein
LAKGYAGVAFLVRDQRRDQRTVLEMFAQREHELVVLEIGEKGVERGACSTKEGLDRGADDTKRGFRGGGHRLDATLGEMEEQERRRGSVSSVRKL